MWLRRLLLRSAVLAMTLSVFAVPSPAHAAVDPASTVEPVSSPTFQLTSDMSLTNNANLIDVQLSEVKRSVDWVMDHANRVREPLDCHPEVYQPVVDQGALDSGFCWDNTNLDDLTNDDAGKWTPQGITTTRDALGANEYDGHQLVATTWYYNDPDNEVLDKESRLSLADFDADWPDMYRHLLLVEPTGEDGLYKSAKMHAGGAMWYGHLLYVADSAIKGFRIFDFDRIYSADTSSFCDDKIGPFPSGTLGDTTYCASGYAYIMVQVGTVTVTSADYLRVSTLSLDRSTTPDSFVVSEFASPNEGTQSDDPQSHNRLHPYVVRWQLDFNTRLPSTGTASAVYRTNIQKMQGVASRNGTLYFASSNGSDPGVLRSWNSTTGEIRRTDWVIGAESLSYWGGTPDFLWTCTERPNQRVVIAARPTDLDL